jgi:hypothetical protein
MKGLFMRKTILVGVFVLVLTALASAQVAVSGDKFGWDYAAADITQYSVVRFEIQVDGGAWASVGLPTPFTNPQTAAGKQTYAVPFPAMQPGQHTISVRACNVDLCSAGIAPFAFKLAIVPADGSNGRVIKGQ